MILRVIPKEGSRRALLSLKKHGGHIDAVREAILPAIKRAETDSVDDVAKANVRMTVERLKKTGPFLTDAAAKGDLEIVTAFYDLKSGMVELL
jgi:carbonic anhydrase